MAGALGLVITTDVPIEGRHAIPVYVDDSLPIVGPSRACVVTSGEIPQAGGPPLAVRLAPAGVAAVGPAIPVYVVPGGGSLSSAVVASLNILNEQFTTTQAAPLTSPRNAEPGPGVGTIVDTTNKLSIAGSILAVAGGTGTWGDPGINWQQTIFPVNRVFDFSLRQRSAISSTARIGFRSGANPFADSSIFLNANNTLPGGGGVFSLPTVQNTWYQCRIVSATERFFMFVKGGIYTNWRLIFVTKKAESPNLFPAFTGNVGILDLDDLLIYDSTGWGELGLYTGYSATGAAITGVADGLTEITWTAQAAETFDLQVRRTDDNNCLIVRGDQAGSTIKLFTKVAGVETQIATAAQTWLANTTYTILVYTNGTAIQVFTVIAAASTASYAGPISTTSSVQQSATGAKTSGAAWVKDLLAYPLTYADGFITQTALRTPINVMPYGDSKTNDSSGFKTDKWPQYFCRAVGASETPTRIAVSGQSTAAAKIAIDAALAAAVGTPNYILYNLGANDVVAMPAQATWETNTAYILDAMHTKWPSAQIYLMRVWIRAQLANCNTLATWQGNVLATRSAWAHVGPDERIFLENGDDGARYTSDGTHPRVQEGYILTAAQWKTALGL